MGIESYRARQFREMFATGKKPNDDKVVYDIIRKADGDLKKEEIVHKFATIVDVEYEVANTVVTECLAKLCKMKCIERVAHGHYQFVRQGI